MAEERRSYSRVATCVDGWLRRLSGPDAQPALRESLTLGDAVAALKGSGLPESAAAFLYEMNAKLDAILGLLSRESLLADFPLKAQVVEIGGGGVKFYSSDAFTLGEHLEVALALRKLPFKLAGAIGRIERKHEELLGEACPPAPEVGCSQLWALGFTRLREQDLDAIVSFVLQEERRGIREIKVA